MKAQWYRIVDVHASDAWCGKGKFNNGDIIQAPKYHPDYSGEYRGYGRCAFKKKFAREWHFFFNVKLDKITS